MAGENMGNKTDKLRKKWKNGNLTRQDIQEWISQYPPDMTEKEHYHIANNLHNLYTDIRKNRKGTGWTKAIKEGRLIDATIQSDLTIAKGWNKIGEFLYRIPPKDTREAIESGAGIDNTNKAELLAYLFRLEEAHHGDLHDMGYDDAIQETIEKISTEEERKRATKMLNEE